MPADSFGRAAVRFAIMTAGKINSPFFKLLKAQDPEAQSTAREELISALTALCNLYKQQSEGPYFLGESPSLADCSVLPFLLRIYIGLGYYRDFKLAECSGADRLFTMLKAAAATDAFKSATEDFQFYIDAMAGSAEKASSANPVIPDSLS
jgi:glutathione S-transferase